MATETACAAAASGLAPTSPKPVEHGALTRTRRLKPEASLQIVHWGGCPAIQALSATLDHSAGENSSVVERRITVTRVVTHGELPPQSTLYALAWTRQWWPTSVHVALCAASCHFLPAAERPATIILIMHNSRSPHLSAWGVYPRTTQAPRWGFADTVQV